MPSCWRHRWCTPPTIKPTRLGLLGGAVNTDGIDLDGVRGFTARDCFIRCEDDGFGWHASDAQANGEPPTEYCLAEDCVIWNTPTAIVFHDPGSIGKSKRFFRVRED